MSELATTTMEWCLDEWDGTAMDDDPCDRLYDYIIDPRPFEDSLFDEGGEGD